MAGFCSCFWRVNSLRDFPRFVSGFLTWWITNCNPTVISQLALHDCYDCLCPSLFCVIGMLPLIMFDEFVYCLFWILAIIQEISRQFSPWFSWLKGAPPGTYPSSCEPKKQLALHRRMKSLWLFGASLPQGGLSIVYIYKYFSQGGCKMRIIRLIRTFLATNMAHTIYMPSGKKLWFRNL